MSLLNSLLDIFQFFLTLPHGKGIGKGSGPRRRGLEGRSGIRGTVRNFKQRESEKRQIEFNQKITLERQGLSDNNPQEQKPHEIGKDTQVGRNTFHPQSGEEGTGQPHRLRPLQQLR